ncbi:MAG: putative RND superfamily exporter protein [Saprospiraceae bacterium]|jgi:predicted RND superfamily exporter protein
MSKIKEVRSSINSFAVKWTELVLKFRWPVLVLSILLAFGLGSQAKMQFDGDYHAFFSKANPESEAFDALQDKYSKDDNIVIVLSPNNKEVFTKENLAAIEELTAAAWNTPYSSRVDAVTNFQYTRAVDDDLFVDDLAYESNLKTKEEIAEIKKVAMSEPLLVNRLLNKDGSVTALNVTVKLPGEDTAAEIPEVTSFVRSMISDFKDAHPNFKVHTSGMVPLNTAFFESAQNDMALIGIMFLIVIFTTLLLTRSIASTISTIVVVIFSIVSAVGFVGITGIKLTPPSSVFPTMILTLAVADSIHILITMLQKMRQDGLEKRAAILESMRLNFAPVFITSLTTVIGFLTMNFGDVPPFWHLGNITAFGMTMAFLFSTTTLPALMSILPVKVKHDQDQRKKTNWFTKIGNLVTNHPIRISIASFGVIGILTFLASLNSFNDDFVGYFDESIQFREDTDYISENLTGILNVEFSLGSGESGGISNPKYLQDLTNFESWLNDQPEVVHVNSFSEVARRVNKSMHGDDPAHYKVPDNREEAAQYLLLYELSLPFGLDLNNQINVDKSETRLTATIENLNSAQMIEFTERAQNWLSQNTPSYMHALGVSPTLMFSKIGFRQADSMLIGNTVALFLISLILMFALKSTKLGLLSLIPNVAPIIVGFGFWYLYRGEINVGMVVVFGMTLGIIVDDTVHFMSKFLRAQREYGYNAKEAVIYAFETVGKALLTTTFVLLAGFTVLATSSFALNSYMARITVVIIPAALIIDFLFLPALLILVSGDRKKEINVKPATLVTI